MTSGQTLESIHAILPQHEVRGTALLLESLSCKRQCSRDPLTKPQEAQESLSKQFAWEPAAPCKGLSGPPGPKCRGSLEISPGISGHGTPKKSPKSPGQSKNTLQTLSGDSPEIPQTVAETMENFWGPMAGDTGRHFRDFFGISSPEGPRDPCKGRAGSQKSTNNPSRTQDESLPSCSLRLQIQCRIMDEEDTAKNLCDKEFGKLLSELSCAICLKTVVLQGILTSNCSDTSLAVRAISGFGSLFGP